MRLWQRMAMACGLTLKRGMGLLSFEDEQQRAWEWQEGRELQYMWKCDDSQADTMAATDFGVCDWKQGILRWCHECLLW